MYFYRVLASSNRFHSSEPLTYSSDMVLKKGAVVVVALRSQRVLGVVVDKAIKPSFLTKAITRLVTDQPLPSSSLELLNWLRDYYPAPLGVITSQFLPGSLIRQAKPKELVKNPASTQKKKLPVLTAEQKQVLAKIQSTGAKTVLLHGDTGTGKTRVYIELAKQQLKTGNSVLILTPEIGLTPQLVRDFEETFVNQVVVMHSNLKDTARRKAWLQVLEADKPVIVIGPRSALFAPFKKLGLIVVDEAHETAYKQEQAPYYQAVRVAGKLADIHKSLLVFGTATPTITEYYIAEAKNIPILRMQELATKSPAKSEIKVISGRDMSRFTQHSYLSDDLLTAIDKTLQAKEQSLVFLNRRGTARLVLCQNCGWQAMCPICDLPLTYHGDSHTMRCHTCGHKEAAVSVCPVCGSADIIFKSIGTKSLETVLRKFFPRVRIQRFDTDNNPAERLEEHYQAIASGDIDILVGTQILTKGLDLPKLALVGVVAADSSLYFPDYTADERTYQLLSQVIGRVGRGYRASQAIIQTYNPESPPIQAALNKDWDGFYKTQLKEREAFLFPPFCYLLKLSCSRKSQKAAILAANNLRQHLQRMRLPVQIIGPSPAFHEKNRDSYQWQLVVKAKNRGDLLKIVSALPANWSYDLDPANLL